MKIFLTEQQERILDDFCNPNKWHLTVIYFIGEIYHFNVENFTLTQHNVFFVNYLCHLIQKTNITSCDRFHSSYIIKNNKLEIKLSNSPKYAAIKKILEKKEPDIFFYNPNLSNFSPQIGTPNILVEVIRDNSLFHKCISFFQVNGISDNNKNSLATILPGNILDTFTDNKIIIEI